ncbi:hypothetical protein X925_05490 [Petrotoga sp. 9T1HF07.CasAA.8.2]|nr:hypothetical protein X925_05490 [Petrotoga sp. 9T1HF07.CasAA.8.2]
MGGERGKGIKLFFPLGWAAGRRGAKVSIRSSKEAKKINN